MIPVLILSLVFGAVAALIVNHFDWFEMTLASGFFGSLLSFAAVELLIVVSPGENLQLGPAIVGALVLVFSMVGAAVGLLAQHYQANAEYTFPTTTTSDGAMKSAVSDGKGGAVPAEIPGLESSTGTTPATATSGLLTVKPAGGDTPRLVLRKPVEPVGGDPERSVIGKPDDGTDTPVRMSPVELKVEPRDNGDEEIMGDDSGGDKEIVVVGGTWLDPVDDPDG